MARPNKGLGHVDGLQGDPESKYQLKVVLATITGEMLVDEAYEDLGIGPSQFANLRKQVLQAALGGLQPRPVGRPRRVAVKTEEEILAMERQIKELEQDMAVLRSRVELAVLPLLRKAPPKRRGQTASPAAPP